MIKTELIDRLFEVFNTNKTKNGKVTTQTYSLEYNWLVKHNLEVNWDKETIWFIRYLKEYRIQHQNILFTSRTRRILLIEDTDKEHQEIGKEPDPMNPEDLPEYIWSFIYLFNRLKFENYQKEENRIMKSIY